MNSNESGLAGIFNRFCFLYMFLSNCQNIFFSSSVSVDVKTTFANDNTHGSCEMTKMGSKVNELDIRRRFLTIFSVERKIKQDLGLK